MANKKSPSSTSQTIMSKSPDLPGKTDLPAQASPEPAVPATTPAVTPETTGEKKPAQPLDTQQPSASSPPAGKSSETGTASTLTSTAQPIATHVAKPEATSAPVASAKAQALQPAEPPVPSEADFVAAQPDLPTTSDDEGAKLELLRDVEAQFELFLGAN